MATMRDMRRYIRHACIGWNRIEHDEGQLEGRMIANYHVVEKGLSMPDFRPLAGVSTVKTLIGLVEEGGRRFCWDENVNYGAARQALSSYGRRHQDLGIDLSPTFESDEISLLLSPSTGGSDSGGAAAYLRESYFSAIHDEFSSFAKSRHSCRVFETNTPIAIERILEAVDVARHSPSVCNRQCWRVHVYQGYQEVQDLLALQEGNRGFGHTIPSILIVTAGLKVFEGYKERNQAYIDGGLFSMSLMYALHHQELGCVPMCWLASEETDQKLRKLASIGDDEVVLMFLGVGVPVAEFSSPVSQKRTVAEIVQVH